MVEEREKELQEQRARLEGEAAVLRKEVAEKEEKIRSLEKSLSKVGMGEIGRAHV